MTNYAERAYSEVAAKDYAAAIRDFRVALVAEPANLVWRKDLAFACLSSGDREEAAAEFSRVFSGHPEEIGVALQLGYIHQQLGRPGEAKNYFEIVAASGDAVLAGQARTALAESRASDLRERKQKGYDLLAAKRRAEAIEEFESVRTDDPSDLTPTLQLGYLYAATGNSSKAVEMFEDAAASPDPLIAAKGRAGLEQMRHDSKLWFANIYAAPFYQSRFSNEINTVNAKFGLSPTRYFQPYFGVRFSRDIRSQSGTLPLIFSDNTAVLSGGIQSTLGKTGAVLYAEAGTAVNLLGGSPKTVPDYRGGLIFSRSWSGGNVSPAPAAQSLSWTGSVYADGGYYTRYDHDVIGSVQLREGIRLPTGRALPMQLLGGINAVQDSKRIFYNNVAEVGPILRVTPLVHLPSLSFETQYFRGFYTAHDPANPYGPRYGDVRVLLIWSKNF